MFGVISGQRTLLVSKFRHLLYSKLLANGKVRQYDTMWVFVCAFGVKAPRQGERAHLFTLV